MGQAHRGRRAQVVPVTKALVLVDSWRRRANSNRRIREQRDAGLRGEALVEGDLAPRPLPAGP